MFIKILFNQRKWKTIVAVLELIQHLLYDNSHSLIFLPLIQLNWETSFFPVLKAYCHNVCAHCICHVFCNKRVEKSYNVILDGFWVSFLKIKQQDTRATEGRFTMGVKKR